MPQNTFDNSFLILRNNNASSYIEPLEEHDNSINATEHTFNAVCVFSICIEN